MTASRLPSALSAVAALVLAGTACPKSRTPELHVLNWSEYFARDTLSGFEREAGCRVVLDYIVSSEELRAKLARTPSGYDVVFPSDEVMPGLISGGALERLDHARLANLGNLDPRFRGLPFDPRNEHSVPYMWGTTGLAYSKDRVKPAPDSWAHLLDPAGSDHATLLDDALEVFAAAMRAAGDDPDAPSPASIERAKKRLLALRPLAFESAPKRMLIVGDAWIAQCFSGDALQAATAGERTSELAYVIPREGGTLFIDNMCIAKGASEPGLAHRFIDYLLRPEVAAAVTNELRFPSANAAARAFVKKEILDDRLVYPGSEELARCRLLREPAPELRRMIFDAWAEVKRR